MKRIFQRLSQAELFLASCGLLVTVLLIFCQVINRYWLHYEIMWINDFALYIFIFTIYISIPYGASQKTHIAVDVLPDVFYRNSKVKRAVFEIFKSTITIVMIFGMVGPTWTLVKRALKYPEYATLIRWFNMNWLTHAMGVMVILVILHYGWHAASSVFELKKLYWLSHNQGKEKLDV